MAYNEDSSGSGHDEPWIQWFCGLKGHEMFCEVERSFIEDGFNLYGLRASVNNFSDCLDLILDRIGPDDSDDSHLTQSAFILYGLIHARYIVTAHGLDAMYNKFAAKEFGTCPLVQCQGQPVLPIGLKDEVGYNSVEIFCPKCQCVYHPPPLSRRGGSAVDGASFGTTFAHLFLMTFSNLIPDPLTPDSTYVPRIFGFRVHPSARQRPAISAANNEENANICDTKASGIITAAVASINNAFLDSKEVAFPQSQHPLSLQNDHNNALNISESLTADNVAEAAVNIAESTILEANNKNGTRNGKADEKTVDTRQQQQDKSDDDSEGNDICKDASSKPEQQYQLNKKRSTTDYGEISSNKNSSKQSKRKKQISVLESI